MLVTSRNRVKRNVLDQVDISDYVSLPTMSEFNTGMGAFFEGWDFSKLLLVGVVAYFLFFRGK